MADPKADLTERGMTGLRTSAGQVAEEFLTELQGQRGIKVYGQMKDNDPTIGSILFAIDQSMRQVEWTVEPNQDKESMDRAEDDAQFLQECMDDLSHTWQDFVSEIMTMIPFGFSLFETVYKKREGADGKVRSNYDDGKIGWRKFATRSQDSIDHWEFDEDDGGVNAVVQKPPPSYKDIRIPIEKLLLFRTTTVKNNPEGRALDPATLIPTPDGWRTMGDLCTGDKVFDEQGRIRYVTATADWDDRPRYRMTFSDGTVIIADAEHQWVTTKVWERSQGKDAKVRTTTEIAASVKDANGVSNHGVAWAGALDYPTQNLLIDPYVLGLWLGDGTTLSASIAAHADDVDEEVALIEAAGYATKVTEQSDNGAAIKVYGGLQRSLRELGVLGDKHVPSSYLRSNVADRHALLAGLMDSDGTVDRDGRCEFTNTNIGLVDAVAELVRSLGMSAKVSLRKRANGVDHMQDSYCVKFTPEVPVFRLSRKVARCKPVRARKQHYITSVERIEDGPTKCIEVDSQSHLFLAGAGMIPTHNSVLRNAYRPWYYKSKIEEIEATGIERDLAGLPVAYVDAAILREDASDDDKAVLAAVKDIVANIKRDREEGVVWPTVYDANGNLLYKLELLSSGGSRSFDTTGIIDRYDKRIAMSVLADFIMLGSNAVGSFALASSKTNMFAQALGAWLQVVEGVFNTYAVPRLFAINGMDATNLPQIKHGDIESLDLAELGAYLSQLAANGMPLFPNAALEEHLLDLAGLPQPTPDEKDEQEAGAAEAAAGGPMMQDPNAAPQDQPPADPWEQALSSLIR